MCFQQEKKSECLSQCPIHYTAVHTKIVLSTLWGAQHSVNNRQNCVDIYLPIYNQVRVSATHYMYISSLGLCVFRIAIILYSCTQFHSRHRKAVVKKSLYGQPQDYPLPNPMYTCAYIERGGGEVIHVCCTLIEVLVLLCNQ